MVTRLFFGAGTALIFGALAAGGAVARQDGQGQGLRRAEPVPLEQKDAENPLQRVFGREFDRDRWMERLADPDLARREGAYEDLIQRARIDPLARAFVEELSVNQEKPELAWTARLALRELGRVEFPLVRVFPDPFAPFGSQRTFGPQDRGLDGLLQEMWSEMPDFHALMVPRQNRVRLAPGGGAAGSGRSVEIRQTPDGARIVITETVDGHPEKKEYRGESLDAILRDHPELKDEIQVSTEGLPEGFQFQLNLPERQGPGLLSPFDYGEGRRIEGWFDGDKDGLERLFSPTEPSKPLITDRLGVLVLPLTAAQAAELGLEPGLGLDVQSTYPKSIADLLGVRSGDVLLELNGKPLRDADDITDVMRARGPDDGVTLVWIDDLGQRHTRTWKE